MRLMGRITADKRYLASLTAELQAAGYQVDVMPDELVEDPVDADEHAFIEAWREATPQECMDDAVSEEMLMELEHIANKHGYAMCFDCGPIPLDHVSQHMSAELDRRDASAKPSARGGGDTGAPARSRRRRTCGSDARGRARRGRRRDRLRRPSAAGSRTGLRAARRGRLRLAGGRPRGRG